MAATKALTKEQRKHIQLRLTSIFTSKATKIQNEFNIKPENQYYGRVTPRYPDTTQVMLKLAGFESQAVLLHQGDELKNLITRNPNINLSAYCHPVNAEEVNAHKAQVDALAERRRTEVDVKTAFLKNKYNQLNDILALTNDVEYITNSIAEYENLEV